MLGRAFNLALALFVFLVFLTAATAHRPRRATTVIGSQHSVGSGAPTLVTNSLSATRVVCHLDAAATDEVRVGTLKTPPTAGAGFALQLVTQPSIELIDPGSMIQLIADTGTQVVYCLVEAPR